MMDRGVPLGLCRSRSKATRRATLFFSRPRSRHGFCQEIQNVANNYQVGGAPLVDPTMSCTGDSGQVVVDTDLLAMGGL